MPKSVKEAARDHRHQLILNPTEDHLVDQAFLAGAEWMRKQFTLHGTTDCNACDDGRATLYATLEGRCVECANKHVREESAK